MSDTSSTELVEKHRQALGSIVNRYNSIFKQELDQSNLPRNQFPTIVFSNAKYRKHFSKLARESAEHINGLLNHLGSIFHVWQQHSKQRDEFFGPLRGIAGLQILTNTVLRLCATIEERKKAKHDVSIETAVFERYLAHWALVRARNQNIRENWSFFEVAPLQIAVGSVQKDILDEIIAYDRRQAETYVELLQRVHHWLTVSISRSTGKQL